MSFGWPELYNCLTGLTKAARTEAGFVEPARPSGLSPKRIIEYRRRRRE